MSQPSNQSEPESESRGTEFELPPVSRSDVSKPPVVRSAGGQPLRGQGGQASNSPRFPFRLHPRIQIRLWIVGLGTTLGILMRLTLPAEWRGEEELPPIKTPVEQLRELDP